MAQQVVKNPKKRQFLFNPLKRPMPYIGFLIAILFIIFQSSIRQYTSNIIGGWLVSNIRDSTEGNYLLDYEYVRFDIFTKELRIKNLSLALDTPRINEDEYLKHNNNLIYLSTPVVVLKLRSIWDLIVNDKIVIAYVGIQEPNVQLTRSESISAAEKEAKETVTSDKLRTYLKELQVDSFRIVNGTIEIELEDNKRQTMLDFKIRDFTTLLKGFKLDNIDTSKAFHGIYAEKFELEILDQEVSLPKLHHKVGFERLWISSIDSIIQIDTLQITPLAGKRGKISGDIGFNQFTLSGIDFKRAYLQDELDIENILLKNPNINLAGTISKKEASEEKKWINLLFSKINLHHFDVINGDINLDFGSKIALKNLGISIIDYKLDSLYTNIENLKNSLTEFHFDVTNSIIELPDSIHRVEIGQFHLSSPDSLAIINNVRINPIPGRRKYSLYKKQGARLISYSSIKNIILSGINYPQIIKDGQLIVDSVTLSIPDINITEYPYIRSKKRQKDGIKPFLFSFVTVKNGKIKYNKRQGGEDHKTELSGLNIAIENLFNDSGSSVSYDNLDFQVTSGSSQLKAINHTLKFKGIKSHNLKDFDITRLSLNPDYDSIKGEKMNLSATFVKLRGLDQEALSSKNSLRLNTVTIQKIKFKGDFRNKNTSKKTATSKKSLLKYGLIKNFYIRNADVDIKTRDNEITFNDISTRVDSLNYSSNVKKKQSPIEFKDMVLSHGNFKYSSNVNNLNLSGKLGRFAEADSVIKFQDLNIKSGNNINGRISSITLAGFDRSAFFKRRMLRFKHLLIEKPVLNIISIDKLTRPKSKQPFNADSLKTSILSKITSIQFDSISMTDANAKIFTNNRVTNIIDASAHVGNYQLDSLSNPNNILVPGRLELTIDSIATLGIMDTVAVKRITLDMNKGRLFTGEINVSRYREQSNLKIKTPGILVTGFTTTAMLNGDFSLDSIRLYNADIDLILTHHKDDRIVKFDNKKDKLIKNTITEIFKKPHNLMFDTLLQMRIHPTPITGDSIEYSSEKTFNKLLSGLKKNLAEGEKNASPDSVLDKEDQVINITKPKVVPSTNGIIKHIQISNSTFTLHNDTITNHYAGHLNFSLNLDTLVLDTLNKFNLYSHVLDLTLRVNNYSINLPDSLNSLSFDRLQLSTRNGQVDLNGLSLKPRVSKYDYAKLKGFQASVQHLEGLNIRLDQLDLYRLMNEQQVYIKKLSTLDGTLDIFKDKELPIPVNKRVPMPQDAIKSISLPIYIDSIAVENLRINFSSRLSSAYPEGGLNFQELNATVSNITNIDSLINVNPYTIVNATTKMQGQGLLSANFNFDLGDENNGFIFDAHLSDMDASGFSNILEALAFVKIESGTIKDLDLEAKGDNLYAIGNMRFLYNDLKVSTINKKNLKTKGMGKVIKTFFANAFVVKKNNPAFKFFPREGAMYYERDPQKVIFDYVTKTALSGIISSIGARNTRKDIKKIQRESKKQKDEERKALKKANKKGVVSD